MAEFQLSVLGAFYGKITADFTSIRIIAYLLTHARRPEQTTYDSIGGRKACAVWPTRLRRFPACRVFCPDGRRTRPRPSTQRTFGASLLPVADRVFQGQTSLLQLLLARGAAGRHYFHSETVFPRNYPDTATGARERILCATPCDRQPLWLPSLVSSPPTEAGRKSHPIGKTRCDRDLYPNRADRVAQRRENRTPGLHHLANDHR